ncbi:substrate-binding domain-containing protein, partial [Limosilactobacillus fermentum]
FVSDDGIAAGLLNGLTDHGSKVPADFELIAANDTKLTEITRPKMTSVTQPLYDIGAVSMRLLTKLMGNNQATDGEDGDDEQNVILPHGFEERQTTR